MYPASAERNKIAGAGRNKGKPQGRRPPLQKRSGERNSMKREFLQNFRVGDQPLPKEIIDAIMEENGHDIEAAKKPYADYDTIKNQLEEAQKTIQGFQSQDVDAIKKSAAEWEKKYNEAVEEAAQQRADMEFGSALKDAITAARGRNAKAITALLDVDTLKSSKNQEADIKAALEGLKKDSGYLFDDGQTTPPPYAAGTGAQNMAPSGKFDFHFTGVRPHEAGK